MKIAGCDLSISSSGVVIEDVDDQFNVRSVNYFGFTGKKKLAADNILYYNNKEFNTDYEKYAWMIDHILEWCKDCEYIAVEDYAMHAGAMGMILILPNLRDLLSKVFLDKVKKYDFTPSMVSRNFSVDMAYLIKLACVMLLINTLV